MRVLTIPVFLAAALLSTTASAEEKVALLIGNAAYAFSNPLSGPAADVDAMDAALQRLGFQTVVARDLDHAALGEALLTFRDRAQNADTALVYYSGHGMEIDGENYLIPTDARLRRPGSEKVEAAPLSLAIDATIGARRLSVVIVDACRNGAPGAQRSGVSKGFRPVRARPGLAIAFSTSPGEPAWDGSGDLSPYTRALTEAIESEPGLDVRLLLTSLGEDTARYAGADQRPFARFGNMPRNESLSLLGGADDEQPVEIIDEPPEEELSEFGEDVADALVRGDAQALFNYGYAYDVGQSGKPEDDSAAIRLYQAACDLEHGGACRNLAIMFENGEGAEVDLAAALALYRRACNLDRARGCTAVGVMYRDGEGVEKDDAAAAEYYRQGCDGGDARGCTSLGVLYETGEGVAQDHAAAAEFYRKGCDGENALGCAYLGEMYENGKGVEQQTSEAIAFYRKALTIDSSNDFAREGLQRFGEQP